MTAPNVVQSNHARYVCDGCGQTVYTVQLHGQGVAFFPKHQCPGKQR